LRLFVRAVGSSGDIAVVVGLYNHSRYKRCSLAQRRTIREHTYGSVDSIAVICLIGPVGGILRGIYVMRHVDALALILLSSIRGQTSCLAGTTMAVP